LIKNCGESIEGAWRAEFIQDRTLKSELLTKARQLDESIRAGTRLTDKSMQFLAEDFHALVAKATLGSRVSHAFSRTDMPGFHLIRPDRIYEAAKSVMLSDRLRALQLRPVPTPAPRQFNQQQQQQQQNNRQQQYQQRGQTPNAAPREGYQNRRPFVPPRQGPNGTPAPPQQQQPPQQGPPRAPGPEGHE
jgi:hypothetical protein